MKRSRFSEHQDNSDTKGSGKGIDGCGCVPAELSV